MTEIKSIAGLRREVKKRLKEYDNEERAHQKRYHSNKNSWRCTGCDRYAQKIEELRWALKLLDSLEAGLRGRLEEVDKLYPWHKYRCKDEACFLCPAIGELRRVLNGSEIPKKGLGEPFSVEKRSRKFFEKLAGKEKCKWLGISEIGRAHV